MPTRAPRPLLSGDAGAGVGFVGELPARRFGPELGSNIRTVQELLGHGDSRGTATDTHVPNRGPAAVRPSTHLLVAGATTALPAVGVRHARWAISCSAAQSNAAAVAR